MRMEKGGLEGGRKRRDKHTQFSIVPPFAQQSGIGRYQVIKNPPILLTATLLRAKEANSHARGDELSKSNQS